MNTAEKIAVTYMRLNGFLSLPQFTAFDGKQHGHVDIVALRAGGSAEVVKGLQLPLDYKFFKLLSNILKTDALSTCLGIVAEVRTNEKRDKPTAQHIEYVRRFLGEVPLVSVSFADDKTNLALGGEHVSIGLRYALSWILARIEWMKKEKMRLAKLGSWTWSEDFLSEILVLRALNWVSPNTNSGD